MQGFNTGDDEQVYARAIESSLKIYFTPADNSFTIPAIDFIQPCCKYVYVNNAGICTVRMDIDCKGSLSVILKKKNHLAVDGKKALLPSRGRYSVYSKNSYMGWAEKR